ncbi:MAG: glycosyltransferase family 2 protein [Rhodospirillales bacterium]
MSVVVVTWRSAGTIADCLRSVLDGQDGPRIEVLVLDNAGGDATVEIVREGFPEVTLIETGGNFGFARAVNIGAGLARGRYVLLLNPDAVLHAGALPALIRFLEAVPDAGAVAPMILDSDGRVNRYAARTLPRLRDALFRQFGLARFCPTSPFFDAEPPPPQDDRPAAAVGYACGAALLLPRGFLVDTGGLDETIPMYFEDIDLSARIGKAGQKIYVLPHARATHHAGRSSGVFERRGLLHVLEDAAAPWLYFRNYRSRIAALMFKTIIFSGSCARLGFLICAYPFAAAAGWRRRRWAQARAMLIWSVSPLDSLRAQIAANFLQSASDHDRG